MALPNTPPLTFGRYPTPVKPIAELSTSHSELWVKRDDLTHEVYGGNKVRKLEYLLSAARAAGAKRVVTVGAAGSHHVLATTYFGNQVGLSVEAIIVPQPRTDHVSQVLRASLALGMRPFPVSSWAQVPLRLAQRVLSGARPIWIGGSTAFGTMGFVAAARELADQVRAGVLPEPDVCVVALGSGGTAAGLAVGFAAQRMKTRVVGVCVAGPRSLICLQARRLARACTRATRTEVRDIQLAFDGRFLGPGYGFATQYAEDAAEEARLAADLTLDGTYTAKAFAAALWQVRARRARRVVFWNTLSSAPMQPLLTHAVAESALDPALRRLLR